MNDLGYSDFLTRNGLSEEIIWAMMRELRAPIPNAEVDSVFRLAPSPIHGAGMFATRPVKKGEVFPVCRGAIRYNLARFVNHSDRPNAALNFTGGDGWMTVLSDMGKGDEVTMDYNDNKAKSLAGSCTHLATPTTLRRH